MTDFSPNADAPAPTAPSDDQDNAQVAFWKIALAVLTEREGAVLSLRHGAFGGESLSFAAIGIQLGISRQQAHEFYEHASEVLKQRDEMREFARMLVGGDPMDGHGAAATIEVSANGISAATVMSESTEVVADEPVSERDALKLVLAADRELARAIEECVGREDLLAELQRARIRIAAGLREIEQEPRVPTATASASTGKRRGRPENVEETARRAAVLGRVQAGEITNAEAAKEVGISYGAWSAWKSIHGKRDGVIVSEPTGRAEQNDVIVAAPRKVETRAKVIVTAPLVRAARTPKVAELVARIESVERFGAELRRRVRDLVGFVEERGPR